MFRLQRQIAVTLIIALLLSNQVVSVGAATLANTHPDTITGTLVGLVIDNNNAALSGVRIVVINQDTGNQRATITNTEGAYQITFLPLGIYSIEASKEGFKIIKPTNGPVKTALNKVINTAPEIIMAPVNTPQPTLPTQPGQPVVTPGATPPTPAPAVRDEIGALTNSTDATRRANADERQVATLPLAGIRTFDDFALLASGVAPPPLVKGVAGPGIGAGIGTAGQFSVNGQRARSNNFTVDGSDNNDEDVGVRRQGFVSLVPQSIESIKEFQIVSQLWDAELGRSVGSQVNAVSKSGTNQFHGSLYDYFNHDSLNARNFFDLTNDKTASYPLTARARIGNNTQIVPVKVDGRPVIQTNPVEGEDQYQRNQGGVALGFPLRRDKTFFFGSFERQDIKARQESHFSVPTVEQRGFLGSGATGIVVNDRNNVQRTFFPTFIAGDAAFSLFPFPNNPVGPYRDNTFTQVLPADAQGTIFSLKFDHEMNFLGQSVLTGRYNFTQDERKIPAVGEAIFSSLKPDVRTQNISLFLNSQWTTSLSNQIRGSYGRTRLRFDALRNPLSTPSDSFPNDPFLINRPLLTNLSFPGVNDPNFIASYVSTTTRSAESQLGPIGQLVVTPFSSVGLDVYLFPQGRINNTIQAADTISYFRSNHSFKFGADFRRTQLNSFLNRNFRPQILFGGSIDLTAQINNAPIPNLSNSGPVPGLFTGSDLASLGIPTGIFQSLATGVPDSTIGLRFWQFNYFFNDNWRVRRGLTFDYGLRYEYNTVPRETNNRIERTFDVDRLFAASDPNINLGVPFFNGRTQFDRPSLDNAFNGTLNALKTFLDGRSTIFDPDRNNFSPHFGFAWDPFINNSNQAGKTVIRGGIGMYYDVALGSVVSQSRNVFPTFIPINIDVNSFSFASNTFFNGESGFVNVFNPFFVPVDVVSGGQTQRNLLIKPGTLNVLNVSPGALRPLLGLLLNPGQVNIPVQSSGSATTPLLPSGGGLAFTLPVRNLQSPYSLQYNLQIERELFNDYLVNLAYVGSRGLKLTRFRTPNGGSSSPTIPVDPLGLNGSFSLTSPPAQALVPRNPNGRSRPIQGLGAITVFDSSAASTYHSLQLGVTKRFANGHQLTGAYTWSHAIDDVSDVFDVAGAFTLPQDDGALRAERASANFDIRHRVVISSLSRFPYLSRFDNEKGVAGFLLGNWQFSTITTYQTGQPFTVNTSFDINLDGNLTDRLKTANGIVESDRGPAKYSLTVPGLSLLGVNGTNGAVGRNTFRMRGLWRNDLALIKNFRISETNSLVFRAEAFNLSNRTHFGMPVRILESPAFGSAVDTLIPARQIQFALKYVF